MEQVTIKNFREDEISVIDGTPYPKIAGRLRLVHEQNEKLSIKTEIIKHDDRLAVVKAECTTLKGVFCGIGMASLERDQKIAPAILELAETRAIARSLRFSGYGVEFCSAEEVSHLNNGARKPDETSNNRTGTQPPSNNQKPLNKSANNLMKPKNGNNNGGNGNGGKNGNGENGRLSGKQYKYIMGLLTKNGNSKQEIDEHCVNTYGVVLAHLSKKDASSLIESLVTN